MVEDNFSASKIKSRNPAWQRDELIIALDLYFRHNPINISAKHPEVITVSQILSQLPLNEKFHTREKFRNPHGVYMKLCNFLRFDSNYKGKGLERGSKLEEEVWKEFYEDKKRLNDTANSIISSIEKNYDEVFMLIPIDYEEEFPEGKILFRLHKEKERNSSIVKKKKRIAVEQNKLYCEICGFDFQERYGNLGKGFIECHHTFPVSNYMDEVKIKLDDLALVCSNCHRMLHRKRPWLSKEKLKDLLRK